VGDGEPVFVIAELGYNFNTLDEALRSVAAAAEAGADAVKIQTFRAETITTRSVAFPPEAGGVNQYDEFKQYEISEDVHAAIFARAREAGLTAFSTPSHPADVELLERLDVPAYKIGSDDLTNLPLLTCVAKTGKPIIFSSGMATIGEIDEAVRTFRASGNDQLILLHCVSNYPVRDPSVMNLRVIESFRKLFPVVVGFSDHTTTATAATAAVALGARVVERHFVLDKSLPVPDAFFSADPAEFASLVRTVREVEAMLGDGVKRPSVTELQMRRDTRKSLIAAHGIRAGQRLTEADLIVKRPSVGIAPRDLPLVVGRMAKRDIEADEPVTWDLV